MDVLVNCDLEELETNAPVRVLQRNCYHLIPCHCLGVLIILHPVAQRVPICSRWVPVGYKKLEG